jgi:tetratricopeptide (TPR) repeat protein
VSGADTTTGAGETGAEADETVATDDRGAGESAADVAVPEADTAPATAGERRRRARVDPDRLAALHEERSFLLRSLDDLEREHDAGDVDDHDYETLRDDYTARAAAVIRAIESHEQRGAAGRRPRSWRRTALIVAGVAVFAVVAGVLVAQASGRREAGETLTGDIRQSTRMQLADAVQLANAGDYEGAIEVYDEVLDQDPRNAEALAYKGWFLFLDGDPAGLDSLIAAAEADPDFPDTHAFMAIILARSGRPDEALVALDRLDALDPPAEITELVAPVRAQVEAQVADGGTAGGSGGAGGPSPEAAG